MTNLEYLSQSTDNLKIDAKKLYNMAADDPSKSDSVRSTIFELYCITYLDSIAHSLAYIADHMDEKGERNE